MTIEDWLGQENQLGMDIWTKKYCSEGEDFEAWIQRISGGNEEIGRYIKEKKFLFGGRILSNRGLNKQGRKVTYSNCYVIAPPEDEIESIFECAKKLARTYSYGGGCGVDISKLSPRGAKINNAYISIEKMIADSKNSYYEALQASSYDWHTGANDYLPFVRYMLGIIVAAYRDFSSRVELLTNKGLSKPDRIREIIRGTTGKITKKEIMEKCPDISNITIQRTLADMVRKNEIIKISGGRYTSYAWNWER